MSDYRKQVAVSEVEKYLKTAEPGDPVACAVIREMLPELTTPRVIALNYLLKQIKRTR
jgi:hypothetical protein